MVTSTPVVYIKPPKGVPKPSALQSPRKNEITILLIGETGSGKTAFMSLLANLFHGCDPLELEEMNDKANESGHNKTQSQTKDATLYIINTSTGIKIRILDTPGLADTKGLKEDEVHKERINHAIQSNLKYIDAVCILANGTVERLGMATEYTLNQITKMFPYSIIDNIGFIFTHCDEFTRHVKLGDLPEALKAIRSSRDWVIQNPLAYNKSYRELAGDPSIAATLLKKGRRNLRDSYEAAVEKLNDWVGWLDSRKIQPTHEILRLYQMSTDIETQMSATWQRIARLSKEREEAKKLERDLNGAKMSKKDVEERIKAQTEPTWETVETEEYNTICVEPTCHSNCHISCSIPFSLDGATLGNCCCAFHANWGSTARGLAAECTECGHTAQEHRHHYHKHEKKPRPIPEETKEALRSAATSEQTAAAALIFAEQRIKTSNADIQKAQATIRGLIEGYNQLALSHDFVGHIRSAIKMLQAHKSNLETEGAAEGDIQLIDQNIEQFQCKLDLLQEKREAGR
ncbi:unnamed protein product [Rhizoctonia solani]|uniref:AIG1-type G domain-containing protein n=1 Tax=Rhizoctonia solani TaxID=456999 RepID=A0A8H3D4S6_9AGAM|nr:unnamed protein product [Rhizoctonia solani]